ncbi:IS3 family transposase [Gordonia sp. HY285]|uniref:IS3 family transposase n=1 Tax=Gordonia liuliyuniae TaxID=2911517 RepID=UPI001F1AA3D4|nr:IS3 family transposase [Gordonia liuliyuniae]MCF8608941.1 IS3 family transposase [Gordonia liuliyuniae]
MIVDDIDAHRELFGVDPSGRVLTDMAWRSPESGRNTHARGPARFPRVLAEAYAAHAVFQVYDRNRRVYGVRKLWHAMEHDGYAIGRDQVARLMRACGTSGAVRGAHRTITTQRDDRAPRFPDHVERQWNSPTSPGQLWVADCTSWEGRIMLDATGRAGGWSLLLISRTPVKV